MTTSQGCKRDRCSRFELIPSNRPRTRDRLPGPSLGIRSTSKLDGVHEFLLSTQRNVQLKLSSVSICQSLPTDSFCGPVPRSPNVVGTHSRIDFGRVTRDCRLVCEITDSPSQPRVNLARFSVHKGHWWRLDLCRYAAELEAKACRSNEFAPFCCRAAYCFLAPALTSEPRSEIFPKEDLRPSFSMPVTEEKTTVEPAGEAQTRFNSRRI